MQCESRFEQLGEIKHATTHRFAISRSSFNLSRVANHSVFHATTCCGASDGSEPDWHGALSSRRCEIRRQIALMLTPKDSMIAPTATCAVATSAALLLQIVHAPSVIWQATNATQKTDNRLSAATPCASLPTRRQNATTAIAIRNARNRCAICSQIWNAVTSDKPRASRQALILASTVAPVSGIHAPYAAGKSSIAKLRCW